MQSSSPGIQPAEKRDNIGKQMITQMHDELSNTLIGAENVHCKLTLLIIQLTMAVYAIHFQPADWLYSPRC